MIIVRGAGPCQPSGWPCLQGFQAYRFDTSKVFLPPQHQIRVFLLPLEYVNLPITKIYIFNDVFFRGAGGFTWIYGYLQHPLKVELLTA